MARLELAEIQGVEEHVSANHQERLSSDEVDEIQKTPGRAPRDRVLGIMERHSIVPAIAKSRLDERPVLGR